MIGDVSCFCIEIGREMENNLAPRKYSKFRSDVLVQYRKNSERLNKVVIARSEATGQSQEIASLRSQ